MFLNSLGSSRLLVTLLTIAATTVQAGNRDTWNQWRGPNRDGHISSPRWPAAIAKDHLSETWSMPLGPSYSGPIVSADHVFVTETKDQAYEVVRALNRKTGEQVWEAQWKGAIKVPFFAAANGSWIRSTPAFDGERLYVGGIRDVLVCLDASNGKILWKIDFVAETKSKIPSFGFVSSPLVSGDSIFIQAGGGFARINKLTGKIIWHTLKDGGGMYGSAFSSPVMATIKGEQQLVVQSRAKLAGISAVDGKELWSQKVEAFRGMNILTPTIIGDSVFTSSYGGGSALFSIDRNGSKWEVTRSWTNKAQAYMSSPVVVDDAIYLHLRNQRFACLDAKTGKQLWRTKTFGKYWSMIANGNQILALDQRGELLLIEADRGEFKLLDRRQVADDSWAHLAIVGSEVFVRDLRA